MVWINTTWIITFMANILIRFETAYFKMIMNFIRNSVCYIIFIINSYSTIASVISMRNPVPARIWFFNIYFIPKSFHANSITKNGS